MIRLQKRTLWWRVFKTLWLLACVLILVLTLKYRGPEYRDWAEAEILTMMGLSFPSGSLFPVMLNLAEMLRLFDASQANELQEIFIIWVPLFVLGYIQWFVLVPVIVRWVQHKFGGKGSATLSVVPKE